MAQRRLAHRITEIVLGPLPAGDDADLLAALTGPERPDPALARRILAAADGNPFFLEELVRSLPTAGQSATVEIPATVEQVLGSRIARLPVPAQQLLATASVLGRRFALDVLLEVAGLDTVPTQALRELTSHELVVQTQGWPAAEYEFRHALGHEAAYRSLWPPRRREWHRRAAEVLAARGAADTATGDGALARHWQHAGDDERAMAAHRSAARTAFTVHALDVAAHHFAEGLAAARRLGARADPHVRNDLLLGLGQVGRLSGDSAPENHLAQALDAAVATDDPATEWRARYELGYWMGYVHGRQRDARTSFELAARTAERCGETAGQVAALSKISLLQADQLDFVGALSQAERALRLASATDDERALASALDARKLCATFLGELAVFEDLLPRLEAILRRHGELWTLQFVLAEAAIVAAASGRWTDCHDRLAEAERMNQRCGDKICRPFITTARAWVERSGGDYGSALLAAREAVATADGGSWWGPWARTDLGVTLLELCDLPAAIEQLQLATDTSLFAAQQVRSLAHLARARWRNGACEQTVSDLDRAEALLASMSTPAGQTYLFGADAALACAEVRLARGHIIPAEQLVETVVSAAEVSGWPERLAAGLLVAGRCRQSAGDATAARNLTRRALELANATSLPAVAWRARAVLAGLEPPGATVLLRQARHGVLELSTSVPEAELRTCFAEAALAEVDELARPTCSD